MLNSDAIERIKAATITGEQLLSMFESLDATAEISGAGHAALTLGYCGSPQPGTRVPTITLVVTDTPEQEKSDEL